MYQQLLQSSTATGAKPSSSVGGLSLTAEKVLKLLEEIRSLRRQLEESIGNNAALSDQLHSRIHKQHSPVRKTTWAQGKNMVIICHVALFSHRMIAKARLVSFF